MVSRRERVAGLSLWLLAGLVALTAHMGLAIWLLQRSPIEPADDAPPVAIMIDLSDVLEAVEVEENEISPDQEVAALSQPAEEVETLEDIPTEVSVEEVMEAEPVEVAEVKPDLEAVEESMEIEPQEQEPVEEEVVRAEARIVEQAEEVVALDEVEVPLPVERPEPPPRKREVMEKEKPKKPVRQAQKQQAASKQAVQAQAEVRQSQRNAARQSSSGRASSVSPARWQSRLLAHLERRKRYPSGARARGEQGIAYVRFSIDAAGNVLSVRLARSSGHPELDREVLSLVRRASPVPAPPLGVNRNITAPVRFSRR